VREPDTAPPRSRLAPACRRVGRTLVRDLCELGRRHCHCEHSNSAVLLVRGGDRGVLAGTAGRRPRRSTPCASWVKLQLLYREGGGRHRIMSAWQRAQLREVLALADTVLISTEAWREHLPRKSRQSAVHLPVGSPLPDGRRQREPTRMRLGLGNDMIALCAFG